MSISRCGLPEIGLGLVRHTATGPIWRKSGA